MADINTTSLLTEHLGYAPISVIDDVINAVNEIMYKCTQLVEDYLTEREHIMVQELKNKKELKEDDDVVMEGEDQYEIPKDEIELGVAKLETLLESSVDRNFDLFELYSLNNILMIPQDLVDEGWFKLEHHKDMKLITSTESQKLDKDLENLRFEINSQSILQNLLKSQKAKAILIRDKLSQYHQSLTFLKENPNYEKVKPMKENLHFIVSQLQTLYQDIVKIKSLLLDDDNLITKFKHKITSSQRDQFIDSKSVKLLEDLGITNSTVQQL